MGVTIGQVRRVGGIAGIAFVVLALVAFFLPGDPPNADAAATEVSRYFSDKRDEILCGNFLLGLAVLAFLVFVGTLRVAFGAASRDEVRPGSIALAGGVAGSVLLLAGAAVINGPVFREGLPDLRLDAALYDVGNALFFMSGFGFAAFFLGAAMAGRATGALHSALVPAGFVVAVLQALGGIGLFVKSGFFATGGAFGFIAVLAALLWVLVASIHLLRPAAGTGGASRGAGAPAAS